MPQLSLSLLGPLQVTLDGASITAFESDKVRALLVYLAVEADRPHRRGALAGLLWPDRPDRAALLNLNQALSNLRRAIGDRDAAVPSLLISRETIQLNQTASCWVDVKAFVGLLAACEAHQHRSMAGCAPCAERLAGAAALYHGPFLAQFAPRDSELFHEWALVVRERLNRQMLGALETLAAFYERRSEYGPALAAAFRLLELDAWREEAHRLVMRLLWLDGQRSAALAQYERCRALLADELGVEPDDETSALYRQIRDGAPAGSGGARAGAVQPQGDHGPEAQFRLPVPPTPFFGRAAELAQLANRLADPACRLVTIVGLGGSGKTRLAIQAATQQAGSFADGACFVSLAATDAPALLAPTIAQALGLALGGASDPVAQLAVHLRDKELLLVLDNFEQILAAAPALTTLLDRAPRLTVLATSRERLRLRGEWALDIGGLDLPPDDRPATLERSGAAALFLQVARQASVSFAPDAAERAAIARICRALGGHPLAVELAAAWTHVLSCAEIEAELAGSIELLASQAQDTPERHRTLRAVLASSWRRLAEDEQRLARRVSVFRGGFTLEAAVAALDDQRQVAMAGLAGLAGRSLLRRAPDGRYSMHELARQYAGEQLRAAGEAELAHQRHGAFFLALIEQAEPHMKGVDETAWMDRLVADQDNIRAALDRALIHGPIDAARMGAVLRWLWYVRGQIDEGRHWIERILTAVDAGPSETPPLLRARLLQGAGVLAGEQSDYRRATAAFEAALAIYRALRDPNGVQATVHSLGMLATDRGEYESARRLFEESLELCRQGQQRWSIANRLNSLGFVANALGDDQQALRYLEESLALARAIGHDALTATILGNVGEARLGLGDLAAAQATYAEALALQQALGDGRGAAASLQGMGMIALARGDIAGAEGRLREALAAFGGAATPADLATMAGKAAALAAAQGRPAEVVRLCAAAHTFRERVGALPTPVERSRVERLLEAARSALAPADFDDAWAAGRIVKLEELVDDALR